MSQLNVKVVIEDERAKKQLDKAFATKGSAAMDLVACIDADEMTIHPNQSVLVSLGVRVQIEDENVMLALYPRSGLGAKHGIVLGNLTGIIDSDYRGIVKACLWNRTNKPYVIESGEKVCQGVFAPIIKPNIEIVSELDDSERGEGGFGSTGRKA